MKNGLVIMIIGICIYSLSLKFRIDFLNEKYEAIEDTLEKLQYMDSVQNFALQNIIVATDSLIRYNEETYPNPGASSPGPESEDPIRYDHAVPDVQLDRPIS